MIKIISGDTRAGKTTHLFREYAQNPDADGILQPVVDGIRCNYYLKTRELRKLEVTGASVEDVQKIGNYCFSTAEFERTRNYLYAIPDQNRITIIDEIGPLELEGRGMEPGLRELITIHAVDPHLLILVVRSKILDTFFERYAVDRNRCEIEEFRRV